MKSLYAKLALGLLALLVSVGLGYFTLSQTATRHYLQQINHQLNRDLAKNLVADRNLVEDKRLNEAALQSTFMSYMVVNPSIEIYLLDIDGTILSFSADKGVVKRKRVSLQPIQSFLDDATRFPMGDDPRSHVRQKAFSVTPVPSVDNVEGYLYVVLRGEEYDGIEQMAAQQSLAGVRAGAMVFSLFVGLVLGLLVFYWLTQRLRRLSAEMRLFQQEVMGEPVLVDAVKGRSQDEIEELASRFDEMRVRIKQQIQHLRQRDDHRRNLIAQGSHDLRTPLASMLGYLESLAIKGDALSSNERAEYLTVAIRQGKHLNHLVSALFEMASLEARESPPVLEPVMVAEFLFDLSQKHRLQAEIHSFEIVVDTSAGLPLVMADLALFERVMDNLISNALAHSAVKSSSGNQRLELRAGMAKDGLRVKISVVDYGKGVSAEEQAHIFEPFYRVSHADTEPGHAGLGLAIVKRIMVMQGGEVSVSSEFGQGAAFHVFLQALSSQDEGAVGG